MKHIYAMGLGLLLAALVVGCAWAIATKPAMFFVGAVIAALYFLGRAILCAFFGVR